MASVSLTFLFAMFALIPLCALLLACYVLKRAEGGITRLVREAEALAECWVAAADPDAAGSHTTNYDGDEQAIQAALCVGSTLQRGNAATCSTTAAATLSAACRTLRMLFAGDSAFTQSLTLQLDDATHQAPSRQNEGHSEQGHHARSLAVLMKHHVTSLLSAGLDGAQPPAAVAGSMLPSPHTVTTADLTPQAAASIVLATAAALHYRTVSVPLSPQCKGGGGAANDDAQPSLSPAAATTEPVVRQVQAHFQQHAWLLRDVSPQQLRACELVIGGRANVVFLVDRTVDACACAVRGGHASITQRRMVGGGPINATPTCAGRDNGSGRASLAQRGFRLSSILQHAPAPSTLDVHTRGAEQQGSGAHEVGIPVSSPSTSDSAHADTAFMSRVVAACVEAAGSELSGLELAQSQSQHARSGEGTRGSAATLPNTSSAIITRDAVQLLVTAVLRAVITTAADHARCVATQLTPQVRELHGLQMRARTVMAMRRAKRHLLHQRFLARWTPWICCCVRDGTSLHAGAGKRPTPGTSPVLHASGALVTVAMQCATAESTVQALGEVSAMHGAGGRTAASKGAHAPAATRVISTPACTQEHAVATGHPNASAIAPAVDCKQRKMQARRILLSDAMSELLDLASEVRLEAAAPFAGGTDIAFGLHSAASCVEDKRSGAQMRDAVFDGQHPVYANPLLRHGRAGMSPTHGTDAVESSAGSLKPGSNALSGLRGADGRKTTTTAAAKAEEKTDVRQLVSMGPISVRHAGQ
ncbi:hypothetical protein EON66_04440 [archaeon]|nr:MAG: hypothetical protein EON66_04440 [archaeon]